MDFEPWAPPPLRGLSLRYVLALHLAAAAGRPCSVDELVTGVERAGFLVAGRPSKAVSDALRWEVARNRVVRLDRNRYAAGHIPRSTRYRIEAHVRALPRCGPLRRAS